MSIFQELSKVTVAVGAALLALSTLAAEKSQAVIITPPPTTWLFQNTQAITATDFRVVRANPLPGQPPLPGIDINASSGGAAFPNKKLEAGTNNVAIYTGPPGVPAGGFFAHSFPNWPAGTLFSVLFSYNNQESDLRQPGRVWNLVDGNFVFLPELSPSGPSVGQLPPTDQLLADGGKTVPVPEPLTILGTATALGFGAFFKRKLKSSESAEKETINVG
jgi:hypothetical protein